MWHNVLFSIPWWYSTVKYNESYCTKSKTVKKTIFNRWNYYHSFFKFETLKHTYTPQIQGQVIRWKKDGNAMYRGDDTRVQSRLSYQIKQKASYLQSESPLRHNFQSLCKMHSPLRQSSRCQSHKAQTCRNSAGRTWLLCHWMGVSGVGGSNQPVRKRKMGLI